MLKRSAMLLMLGWGAVLLPAPAHAGGDAPYEPPPNESAPYGAPPYYDDPQPYPDGLPPRRAAALACRADIEKYCSGVLPGRGRIISCLAGNRDRLSPPCDEVLRRAEQFFRR